MWGHPFGSILLAKRLGLRAKSSALLTQSVENVDKCSIYCYMS